MRKFLVHNFAGNTVVNCTDARFASIIGLLPLTIILALLADDWLLTGGAAVLTIFLFFVPGTTKPWGYLRSMRFTIPIWFIGGILLLFFKTQWIHYVVYSLMTLSVWLSMYGWYIMYFDLFPLKLEELDEEQLKLYNSGQRVANLFKP